MMIGIYMKLGTTLVIKTTLLHSRAKYNGKILKAILCRLCQAILDEHYKYRINTIHTVFIIKNRF